MLTVVSAQLDTAGEQGTNALMMASANGHKDVVALLIEKGASVDEKGEQHYLDASLAYKRAVLNAIKYLAQFGYTEEQVYLLLSCCPCEGRISGIVDVPNAVATLAIPLAIFNQDVRPKAGAVLEALAAGVTVKMVGRDLARQSDDPPKPFDPRLSLS